MNEVKKIASFEVNHNLLTEGIYVSRIDGDITTYDLRTRIPNAGDYMDNLTMHSLEHMFATYVRSSEIADSVIYFGPMGCQTGFYLLVRNADNGVVLEIFGKSAIECGNYRNLDLGAAKAEAERYLLVLTSREQDFKYKA